MGIPYAMIRPTLVIGNGDLLANKMAWPQRRVNGAEKLGHWGAGIVYHLPDDRGP